MPFPSPVREMSVTIGVSFGQASETNLVSCHEIFDDCLLVGESSDVEVQELEIH